MIRSVECGWDGMERYKKGAELAAWHHGYQAGEFAVARLCPYSTGSALAKAWHEGYQKAREEQGSPASSKAEGNQ
jgi:ribosome modulation factor